MVTVVVFRMSIEVTEELLQSSYVINKHAKQYADKAHDYFRQEKHATAQKNSTRKEALYSVKTEILQDVSRQADRIVIHTLNCEQYYCFYFDGFSFHSPVSEHSISQSVEVEQVEYTRSAEKEVSRTLKESLQYIASNTPYNPNEFLTRKYVLYGTQSYFTGWKYV